MLYIDAEVVRERSRVKPLCRLAKDWKANNAKAGVVSKEDFAKLTPPILLAKRSPG